MHNYSVDQDCLNRLLRAFTHNGLNLIPLIAFGYFNKTQLHFKFAFQTKLSIHRTLKYFQNFEIENNDYEKDWG